MVALLTSGCPATVPIQDEQRCALIPGEHGAVCDWLLHKDPQTITQAEWIDLQNQWALQGQATECMQAQAIADEKAEIEKFCSVVNCDYQVKKSLLKGLAKFQRMGKHALSLK